MLLLLPARGVSYVECNFAVLWCENRGKQPVLCACIACVRVGLLPVDGTIWNGVRICDKLQIYLGVAHWRIDWAPCDRMRNAGSGVRSWLSSFRARSEDAQPKITSKNLFLALSVIMMAQHDLKEVDAVSDPWCWQRWKKKIFFFVGPAVTETWNSAHLAPLNKIRPLTGKAFILFC